MVSSCFAFRHGPVGARDVSTLLGLKQRNVPSYMSGCFTLLLKPVTKAARTDAIYVVDTVGNETLEQLFSKELLNHSTKITHKKPRPEKQDFATISNHLRAQRLFMGYNC